MQFGAFGVAAGVLCIAAAVWWKVLATRWVAKAADQDRHRRQTRCQSEDLDASD